MPTDQLKRCLSARPEVPLSVLFGSAARGASHEGSDVGVGVLLPARAVEARQAPGVTQAGAARRPGRGGMD